MDQSSGTAASEYVFDLDGTLITLPVAWDKVRTELRGVTNTSMEFNPFFLDVQVLFVERPELRAPVLETIDRFESLVVGDAKLMEGAYDALSILAARARLSLVTMQGVSASTRILDRLGISKFFASKFTREDSMDRSVQLESALESIGAEKDGAVFVGDRINDLKAARKVGVRFVMIRSRPDNPPADALYRSMKEFASSPWVRG